MSKRIIIAADKPSKRLVVAVEEIRASIEQLPIWNDDSTQTALTQELTQTIARRWFEHAYELPDPASGVAGELVRRGTLQKQLNDALAQFGLDNVRRRDTIWRWFLITVVGIPEDQYASGRPVRLCDRRSARNFADTCQDLLQDTGIAGVANH